ncbi:uncharacterized protein K02A2.6 [Exaiptasia diaphana]|uniref:Endonuclease n=1 Tax=Exaiptasia diaphana TaxID=2652724 RepID=A0A913YJ66_EXADI|nr:uncharacterized protein K02A2.6 [Exaiptasia diaphana]
MASHIKPPSQFDFRKPEGWTKWIQRFERYRIASGLNIAEGDQQVNTLLYTMGEEGDEIMKSFTFKKDEASDYRRVKEKFDDHFVATRNVIFERAKFNLRRQEQQESVDTFITALYSLSEHCEFGDLRKQLIRDRIVVGLADAKLSEKLQLDSKLTLEKAIEIARQSESVKKQQQVLRNPDQVNSSPSQANVDAINTRKNGKPRNARNASKPTASASASETRCQRCGNTNHKRSACPAKDAQCHNCNKKGHFSKVCRSAKVNAVETEETDDEYFFGEISGGGNKAWKAKVKVNNVVIDFKLDSGADVTVIGDEMYKTLLSSYSLRDTNKRLYGPCRTHMKCLGTIDATLELNGKTTKGEIYVIKDLETPLLSRAASTALGGIARVEAVSTTDASDVKQQFPKLFTGMGCMDGEYEIKLKPDVKPFNLTTPRRIAIPLRDRIQAELDRMERMDVIEKVDGPTDWCSPMVVVPKDNGKVRICGDFVQLNKAILREVHQMPTTEETLANLAGANVCSKLDANSGFWQRKLEEKSKVVTTFITPWGRYCYKRLPFGISSAPEHFQKTMQRILEGLPGVVCQVDDMLVHGKDKTEHGERLNAVLTRLQDAKVTLNADKCQFECDNVKFLGHIVGKDGIRIDPSKVEAIKEMAEPSDVSDLRRFLGMVNQVGKYIPNLADLTKPLRELLVKENAWVWNEAQATAFEVIKDKLSSTPTLAIYDPTLETRVSADASSYGLGAVLKQKHADVWKPVAYISRALTDTETRYAQIEKEALATTWACERFEDFLVGKRFHIETDHKPLVPLFGSKNLSELPPRIQRLRMRLMRFDFSISHVAGKDLITADTLSRAPLSKCSNPDDLQDEINLYVNFVYSLLPATDQRIENIKERQRQDEVCRTILEYTSAGWPERNKVPSALQSYWADRGSLTVIHGLLVKDDRIVIPSDMRLEILEKIHEGHQGITKCRARAQRSVWWPGLSRQIEDLVRTCRKCAEHRVNHKEPMIPTAVPERPWQSLGTDLCFVKGKPYLIVVDYFSKYVEVSLLNTLNSAETIRAMESIFARHGTPDVVRSDNGPQYDSNEFAKFASDWDFRHVTSSPIYPQSNGGAERAVQTVKNLLKKSTEPAKALLAYRATPLENGKSPAELLFGRKIRTDLPTVPGSLTPSWPGISEFRAKEEERKLKQKGYFDLHHNAKDLSTLVPGQRVWITDQKKEAIVKKEADTPRSYVVETPAGQVRRNRSSLVPFTDCEDTASTKQKPVDIDIVSPPDVTDVYRTRSGRTVVPPDRLNL